MDAALEDHRDAELAESQCYRRHVTIAQLNIEDRGCNNFFLQQLKRSLRASNRADDLTAGGFDGYLELERDDRLVFDDEDRNTPKQCKKSIIRVSKPSISMAQSFHREDEIHRETLRIPLVG